jgi:uncharacterized membrane protein YbhN (UPF0104 family)
MPQLPSTEQLTTAALVVGVGSLVVPAAAGIAAARYGRFSPVKAAVVSVGVSIVGAAVLAAIGVGVVATP